MTPSPWIIAILAFFAVCNHLISYIYRIEVPRLIAIPRALGAAVVMGFYAYMQFVNVDQDTRSLIVRWSFILLFAPEGYPITYLLARQRVKHGSRND